MSPAIDEDDPTPNSWVPLENRLYRRDVVYSSLEWTLQPAQLANAIVANAPSAGPLALIPDAGWGLSFALAVYTLSGRLITRFDRLRERTVPPFRAVAVGWSTDDSLTVVYNDGVSIRLLPDLQVSNMRLVYGFSSLSNERVHDAVVLPTGDIIMRTANGKVIKVDPRDDVHIDPIVVPPPETISSPNCAISAVKSDSLQSSDVNVILVTDGGNITATNLSQSHTMTCDESISQIAISANGSYIASLDPNSGMLFVSTIDLRTQIARINLIVELSVIGVENVYSDVVFDAKAPESVAWVGSDAVAVLYREHLVLVGPRGRVALLELDATYASGGIFLQSESDGLRLISSANVQFVQLVPEAVNVVRCQKQTPGFKLMLSSPVLSDEATIKPSDALTRYRLLRELRMSGQLMEGARNCVAAAYLETDVILQKRLLQSAGYGIRYSKVFGKDKRIADDIQHKTMQTNENVRRKKGELARSDGTMIPTAIAVLRVLNSIKSPSAGIPMTKPQLDAFGITSVVARLSRYGVHTLALRLTSFAGIPVYDVLSKWALDALRANSGYTDEELTVLITDRFDAVRRSHRTAEPYIGLRGRALPYVRAAEAAFIIGRPKCAELLLQQETRPAPKVAMYLRMGREGPAIRAAVESGDPELVLDALGTVLEKKSIREIAFLLQSLAAPYGSRATDLLATHLRQIGDMKALRLLYSETRRSREATLIDIGLIHETKDTVEYVNALDRAVTAISRSNIRKACHFEIQALQHASTVAMCAMEVEKRGRLEPGTLRHASDGDLLAHAIVDINDKTKRRDMLARLRRELRVPDRRFFWVCLESMAEVSDFESIEALSYSAGSGRAPPIGLMAFVETCIKYHMEEEAVKYAMRINDLRDRARALASCGRGREAADIASRLRNQQLLAEVQELAARHVSNIRTSRGRQGMSKPVNTSKKSNFRGQ